MHHLLNFNGLGIYTFILHNSLSKLLGEFPPIFVFVTESNLHLYNYSPEFQLLKLANLLLATYFHSHCKRN